MSRQARMLAFLAMGLICVTAWAKSPEEMTREISASTGKAVRAGDTPEQVAAFLKAHNFYTAQYAPNSHKLSGHSMYARDGSLTADSTQAAFGVHVSFRFDAHDRLKDYDVDVEQIGR